MDLLSIWLSGAPERQLELAIRLSVHDYDNSECAHGLAAETAGSSEADDETAGQATDSFPVFTSSGFADVLAAEPASHLDLLVTGILT